jgi:hypothetical protein
MKRRAAIEVIRRHLKVRKRRDRSRPKGEHGDRVNVPFAAAAMNLHDIVHESPSQSAGLIGSLPGLTTNHLRG